MISVVGAGGIRYDIPDFPFNAGGWIQCMKELFVLERTTPSQTNAEFAVTVAYRRYFAEFARQRWDIVICASLIYLLCVFKLPPLLFGEKDVGKTESRFNGVVRVPFALWNLFLSIFSIWGVYHTWPSFLTDFGDDGYTCSDPFVRSRTLPFGGVGLLVFIFSKLPELCDTLFLILKNRPVKLLQWYHHVSVMLFCWLALATEYAPGMWFAVMNYTVHSIMYLWFALFTYSPRKSSLRKFLKRVGPFVTFIQTSQMVVGIFVNAYAAYLHLSGANCHITDQAIYSAIVMYFSYFVLFAKLFYDSVRGSAKTIKETCCKPDEKKRK